MENFKKYFSLSLNLQESVSEEELARIENRLQTSFPEDYKAFPKQVNGFEGFIGKSYAKLVRVVEIEEFTDIYCS